MPTYNYTLKWPYGKTIHRNYITTKWWFEWTFTEYMNKVTQEKRRLKSTAVITWDTKSL